MQKISKKPVETRGRPAMPEEDRRTKWMDVRFTAAEIATLKSRAADSGLSYSAWVRKRLGL